MDQETELYLELYKSLRSEIRLNLGHVQSYLNTGLASIGAILGYALYAETFRLIALAPVVFTVVVVIAFDSLVGVVYLGHYLHRLETEVSETAPLFRWEHEFGYSARRRGLQFGGVDVANFRLAFLVIVLGGIYVALAITAVDAWTWNSHSIPRIRGVAVTQTLLTVLYSVLGGVCVFSGLLVLLELRSLENGRL